jgi:hypothetical protein
MGKAVARPSDRSVWRRLGAAVFRRRGGALLNSGGPSKLLLLEEEERDVSWDRFSDLLREDGSHRKRAAALLSR